MPVRRGMIDFHTHILPGIDDGSRGVEESLEMLRRSWAQGVDTVVLTPHFYAHRESIPSFCARRQRSLQALLEACCEKSLPGLALGAEVHFFEGMSRSEALESLCVGRYLLVEMPFDRWGRRAVQEVQNLPVLRGITPILAHIERYSSIPHWEEAMAELVSGGCLTQMNAEAFRGLLSGRRARALLRRGKVDLLGSDCHNLTSRPPDLGGLCEQLKRKMNQDIFHTIDQVGAQVLETVKLSSIKQDI